jgi:hypothetical protein
MDTHAQDDQVLARRTLRRRGLMAILLGSSLAMLGAGAMSLAVFTDTGTANGAWSTGTIILGVSPATTFGPTGMMPGDTGSQTITVANTGTGALRYAVESVATDLDSKGLAAQLDFDVDAGPCGGTTGNLFSGTLATFAGLGDKAQGDDLGDRSVSAGDTDQLCFSWELPLDTTDNSFQDAGTEAVFTFHAEQTANN